MLYLKSFTLPNERQEDGFLLSMTEPRIQMRCYSRTSSYPFKIFPQKALSRITFEPLTVSVSCVCICVHVPPNSVAGLVSDVDSYVDPTG